MKQEIDGVADKQKSGKAYYVSPKGNDNAKGSKKKPFRTFKRACKSPVSYTHLDVYKRQVIRCTLKTSYRE